MHRAGPTSGFSDDASAPTSKSHRRFCRAMLRLSSAKASPRFNAAIRSPSSYVQETCRETPLVAVATSALTAALRTSATEACNRNFPRGLSGYSRQRGLDFLEPTASRIRFGVEYRRLPNDRIKGPHKSCLPSTDFPAHRILLLSEVLRFSPSATR